MANTYVAPNFSIDTNTNVAGLIALKGSPIATTDNIYVHSNAILTIEQNLSINYFYLNDNPALNAAVKAGYIVSTTGGITITLYDTASNGGLSGRAGTGNGYYSFVGSAGNKITIKGNTANKCTDYNARTNSHVYKFCIFDGMAYIFQNAAGCKMEDCDFINSVANAVYILSLPNSFLRNTITDFSSDCNVLYLNGAISYSDVQNILNNLTITQTGSVNFKTQIYTTMSAGTYKLNVTYSSVTTPTQLDRIEQKVNSL